MTTYTAVTQIGQYRCSCGWVLALIPETGNLTCPNTNCQNNSKQFQAPAVALVDLTTQ